MENSHINDVLVLRSIIYGQTRNNMRVNNVKRPQAHLTKIIITCMAISDVDPPIFRI